MFPGVMGESELKACDSEWIGDAGWDVFLQGTPLGQYQHSAMWAEAKAADGWEVYREIFNHDGVAAGGFQLLHKQRRGVRIGYISKGPVWVRQDETGAGIDELLRRIIETTRRLRLSALIVQAPDYDQVVSKSLGAHRFIRERVLGVITATQLVELTRTFSEVEDKFRKTTRKKIRQTARTGLTVGVQGIGGLPKFFNLMMESCGRQGKIPPNPSSLAALETIWSKFNSTGAIRLSFAIGNDQIIGGLLCLIYGKRLTVWKKGSDPESLHLHSMDLLYQDALKWGCEQGLHEADFCGLRPDIADALIREVPLNEEQMKSRDFYNLGFGGKPLMLPPAMIYIPNRALRAVYRAATNFSFVRQFAKKLMN